MNVEVTLREERRPAMVIVREWDRVWKNEGYYERVLKSEESKRALVHTTFGCVGGKVTVEFEDGSMGMAKPGDVRFLDSEELFGEVQWLIEE